MSRHLFQTCLATALFALTMSQEQPQRAGGQEPKQATTEEKTRESKSATHKSLPPVLPGFDIGKPRKEPTVLGATRGANPPVAVALAPTLGQAFDSNPVFVWSYDGNAQTFIIVVRNEAQEEVFRKDVTGTNYRYPADAPILERGKTYYWTVAVRSPLLDDPSSPPRGIRVVSAARAKQIENKLAQISSTRSYEAGFARARMLVHYRLWYDALAAYDDLIARYPDRAELYGDRATVYAQLDVTAALADRDRARATELRRPGRTQP